jgi:(3S)-malyl-CoA thioesterase
MEQSARPWRSVLYVPADKPRAIAKARDLDCDAIIFDLEDAVAASQKSAARETLRVELAVGGHAPRGRIVRVNPAATPWGAEDLAALRALPLDGVLLPKVSLPADLAATRAALPETPVWAMIETPAAVAHAFAIAAAPGMAGLVMGTNDLATDLGCRARPDRLPLMLALQTCVLAARAAGLVCLDGVCNALDDQVGLEAECRQGRDLGFDGKTLIHPAQLAVANRVFAPSADEIALARRQIAAWQAAEAAGLGVAVVDGKIVENLHIVAARALLAKAKAIAGRGA